MAINNIRTVTVPSIGKLPLAAEPGSFTPSGWTREHRPGRLPEDGDFTKASVGATLELNLNLRGGIDPTALNNIEGEDVTVRLEDGQVHLMSMAYVTAPVPVDGSGSRMTIVSNTSERIS